MFHRRSAAAAAASPAQDRVNQVDGEGEEAPSDPEIPRGKSSRRSLRPTASSSSVVRVLLQHKIAIASFALILLIFLAWRRIGENTAWKAASGRRHGPYYPTAFAASLPVLLALYVAVRPPRRSAGLRHISAIGDGEIGGEDANERVVAAAFVLSILGNQLPTVLAKFGAAALAAGFGLATRPASSSDVGSKMGGARMGAATGRNGGGKERGRNDSGGRGRRVVAMDGMSSGAGLSVEGTDDRDRLLARRGRGGVGAGSSEGTQIRGPWGLTLKPLAFLSTFFLVAVLLTENFLVWVVSATFKQSHDPPYPEALQDNGRIVVTYAMDAAGLTRGDAQYLRDAFNVQWALVTSAVAGALLGCELGLGRAKSRSMWAVGMRAVLSLALARAVRGISFVLTVLPSQVQGCYRYKYPYPPPEDWREWIAVGIKPAARGGCNDLIVSGHATVTSVLACVATSVGDNFPFSVAVWTLLALDYLVEVLQGFHYSVDMWLGAIITSLIFRSLRGVEEIHDPEAKPEFAPLSTLSWRDAVLYGAPALLGFMVLTVAEEAMANVWIVLYVMAAVVTQLRGMTHLSRNILICTLYVALGVYL